MHDEGGGGRGGLFEEGMKILFPSWAGYCLRDIEGHAGVEVVKDFVDLLDFVVDRSWASEAIERY